LRRFADISIVSADSRSSIAGSTSAPRSPRSRAARAPHLGVDVLDPTERASAAWWAISATVDRRVVRGRTPVVVGGTGLYLRALFGTLFEEPPIDRGGRLALQASLRSLHEELRRWVRALDPTARISAARSCCARSRSRCSRAPRERPAPENATAPRWRARYLVVDPRAGLAQSLADETMFARDGARRCATHADVPDDAPAGTHLAIGRFVCSKW
jgi:tRNA dimethylallyltransferase